MTKKEEGKKIKFRYWDWVTVVNSSWSLDAQFYEGNEWVVVDCYKNFNDEIVYDILLEKYFWWDNVETKEVVSIWWEDLKHSMEPVEPNEEYDDDEFYITCSMNDVCRRGIREVAEEILNDEESDYENICMAKTMIELLDKEKMYDALTKN